MSLRWPGGKISAIVAATSASVATGIWTTNSQAQAKAGGVWPGSPTPTVEYLVVAGGGGGGCNHAGGGAGGGMRTAASFSVTAGSAITVTVGASGAGATSVFGRGINGTDSVFSTITASGGGGGGTRHDGNQAGGNLGKDGGSGGGGGGNDSTTNTGGAGNTPATSPSQGTSGGAGLGTGTFAAGGGGGGCVGRDRRQVVPGLRLWADQPGGR